MPQSEVFATNIARYEAWFHDHPELYRVELDAVRQLLPDHGIGLEVGVGSGRFAAPLGVAFGLDPCGTMLEYSQKRGVTPIQGVAEALPCKTVSIDYILMVTVVCFFDDLLLALKEAMRVLTPTGQLVLAFIDRDTPLGRRYVAAQASSTFYRDARFVSAEEMHRLLRKQGWGQLTFRQCCLPLPAEKRDLSSKSLPGYGEGGLVIVQAKR